MVSEVILRKYESISKADENKEKMEDEEAMSKAVTNAAIKAAKIGNTGNDSSRSPRRHKTKKNGSKHGSQAR